MPTLYIKEIIFGMLFSKTYLLSGDLPSQEKFTSEEEMIELMGFRKNTRANDREDYDASSGRVKSQCRILFGIMVSDAYIGRLY